MTATRIPRARALKAVGYWNHEVWRFSDVPPEDLVALTAGFPHPGRLVEALGVSAADERMLRYLRSGHRHMTFFGGSYCRFGCTTGVEGISCVTDGTWVWPEGLAHYVEVHHVPLPGEFLTSMKRHLWRVPPWASLLAASRHWDSTFWVEWTTRCLTSKSQ